jgi:hypothetical protein
MQLEVNKDHDIVLKKVFSGLVLEAENGQQFAICMRDDGFEFQYNGVWYEAKGGVVKEFRK